MTVAAPGASQTGAPSRTIPASANWGLVWSIVALAVGLVLPWADTSLIGEPQPWYLIELTGPGWLMLALLAGSALARTADVTGLIDLSPKVPRILSIVAAVMAALTLVLVEVIGGLGILAAVSTVGEATGRGGVDVSVGMGPWLVGGFSVLALLPDSTWNGVTLGFFEPPRRIAAWLGLIGVVLLLTARYDSFVLVSAGDVEGGLALARLPFLGPLSLILTLLTVTFLALGYVRSKAFLIATIVLVSMIGIAAMFMGAAGNAATRLDSSWVEERIPAEFAEYDPEIVAGRGWMIAVGGTALVLLSAGIGLFVGETLVEQRQRSKSIGRSTAATATTGRRTVSKPADDTTDEPSWGASSSRDLGW